MAADEIAELAHTVRQISPPPGAISFTQLLFWRIAHVGFHIWRHIKLRDNALRIMALKAFHRYL
jgi:cytochrome b561